MADHHSDVCDFSDTNVLKPCAEDRLTVYLHIVLMPVLTQLNMY